MTKHIQRQTEVLKQKILYVGTLVEEAIAKAIAALINRDASLANKIIEADNVIDRMEVDVEEECLKILAALSASCRRSAICGRGAQNQ